MISTKSTISAIYAKYGHSHDWIHKINLHSVHLMKKILSEL